MHLFFCSSAWLWGGVAHGKGWLSLNILTSVNPTVTDRCAIITLTCGLYRHTVGFFLKYKLQLGYTAPSLVLENGLVWNPICCWTVKNNLLVLNVVLFWLVLPVTWSQCATLPLPASVFYSQVDLKSHHTYTVCGPRYVVLPEFAAVGRHNVYAVFSFKSTDLDNYKQFTFFINLTVLNKTCNLWKNLFYFKANTQNMLAYWHVLNMYFSFLCSQLP